MLLFLWMNHRMSGMEKGIFQALSIVEPHGQNIATGRKTLEIRTWQPEQLPLYNLVIVENNKFLMQDGDEDEGYAVAVVDVLQIHDWQQHELEAACASNWAQGYYAWELSNIRALQPPIKTVAKRKIYTIELS